MSRVNRLRKRGGRNVGAEKLAEHQRIESLPWEGLVSREVGVGGTTALVAVAGETGYEAGAHFTAHEQTDASRALAAARERLNEERPRRS